MMSRSLLIAYLQLACCGPVLYRSQFMLFGGVLVYQLAVRLGGALVAEMAFTHDALLDVLRIRFVFEARSFTLGLIPSCFCALPHSGTDVR
ncbi:hypothetical protein ACFJGW_15355 [Burkholderiaceae bacterium UC74_6]